MFSAAALIGKKRDGAELGEDELHAFATAVAGDSVSDAQLGAFLMAVCIQGMTAAEQLALTLAMRDSGRVLEWNDLHGPVLDKHSTGGVGDLVSLVLGPLVAACGAHVPMISGRGLGHTGGTLDKLESIPGFDIEPGLERFQAQVREVGIAIVGQGPDLAPADRRMYAVRDVTGTVDSMPLIVSSILSKKLAEGLDGLVMDIKVGNGAFMRAERDARELARRVCAVADAAGLACSALLTDMNQPLARAAGNALELREAIGFLSGEERDPRLADVIFGLGAELLRDGGLEPAREPALARLRGALDSGAGAERFARMVASQGGPADLLENPRAHLPVAPVIRPCTAKVAGTVSKMDTRAIGAVVQELGGGRLRLGDTIDHRVGLKALCRVGDRLDAGQPLAEIHAADEAGWEHAAARLRSAITVEEGRTSPPGPVIVARIDPEEPEQGDHGHTTH